MSEAIAVRAWPEVEPDSAMRWTRRRVRAVHAGLRAVIGLLPALLAGCRPTAQSIRVALGGQDLFVEDSEALAPKGPNSPVSQVLRVEPGLCFIPW